MKLLIVTQKVDRDDPVLGFFHRWLEVFAEHFESIVVICLQEGMHALPKNVKVRSLGKEKGVSRWGYIVRFMRYVVQFRNDHDVVFVHMNQEYVLLGGLLWRLWSKKVLMWRNHAKGNWLTHLAVYLSNRVLYTSPQSYTARFKKAVMAPVGIDTDFFSPDTSVAATAYSVLFLGRIAPVKNVDVFIEALHELQRQHVPFRATIVGDALPQDASYEKRLRKKISEYELEEQVRFVGAVNQLSARDVYRKHAIYVNVTAAGSMDKTIFEALSCGLVPVVVNEAVYPAASHGLVADLEASEVAEKIKVALTGSTQVDGRAWVMEHHSLSKLVSCVEKHMRDLLRSKEATNYAS